MENCVIFDRYRPQFVAEFAQYFVKNVTDIFLTYKSYAESVGTIDFFS